MSKNPLLSVICLVLAAAALGANHAFGRIQTATLRRLPVESFPKQVAAWEMTRENALDPAIQKGIPTARIVDRWYRDDKAREANLLLLTATDYADFHDPNICFPGQGYALTDAQKVTIGGQQANLMTATQGSTRLKVLYWWSGSAAVDTKYGRDQMGKLLALRDRLIGKEGNSLFVRVIVADTPGSEKVIAEFLAQIEQPLKEIQAAGKEKVAAL